MESLCPGGVLKWSMNPWRSELPRIDKHRWCCSYGCRTQTVGSWSHSPRNAKEGWKKRTEIKHAWIKMVKSWQLLLLRSISHQLLFQVWRTSVSWIPCLSACSSRKSNMYLMARGRVLPRWTVLNSVSKRSSTNFCSVPWSRMQKLAKLNTHNGSTC